MFPHSRLHPLDLPNRPHPRHLRFSNQPPNLRTARQGTNAHDRRRAFAHNMSSDTAPHNSVVVITGSPKGQCLCGAIVRISTISRGRTDSSRANGKKKRNAKRGCHTDPSFSAETGRSPRTQSHPPPFPLRGCVSPDERKKYDRVSCPHPIVSIVHHSTPNAR